MKKYWKSLDELKDIQGGSNDEKKAEPEFSIEGLTEQEVTSKVKSSRRDFLKMLGFSVGTAALAASCEAPVRKAIPYLNQPEEVTPGMANYYASTFYNGQDYCPIVVKVRDGRPIKIEGNKRSRITAGGTSARVQGSVLSLYDDTARLKQPMKNGKATDWNSIDNDIKTQLDKIAAAGGKIVILSASVISPSTLHLFEEFTAQYPTTEIVYHDSISFSGMRMANKNTFDREVIPSYRFDKAEVIVGFNCDFLGGWLSPVEFANQYAKTKDLTNGQTSISKHYQFESYMSLTGSNADIRQAIKPTDELTVLLNLYNKIASKSDMPTISVGKSPVDVEHVANDLLHNQSKSLVVSGTNDVYIQAIVNAINFLLANLGTTFHFERTLETKLGCDQKMNSLVEEMNKGEIAALFMYGVNPVYDYYNSEGFVEGLNKTDFTVSISDVHNETTKLASYVCPDHHYLESWNDAEAYSGMYSLSQPTIQHLFDTRQAQESLMKWAGIEGDFHSYIKKYWENYLFVEQSKYSIFQNFWTRTLQDGTFEVEGVVGMCPVYDFAFLDENADKIKPKKADGIELILYEKIGIGDGKQANNPWLQEMPDPISKAVWDNYFAISPKWAKENGVTQEDLVIISGIELPVLYQPGQAYGTASVALGYGRMNAGKVATGIGKNVFGLVKFENNSMQYTLSNLSLEKTGKTYPLATTQTYHSMEGRPIVRETVLDKWKEEASSGNELHVQNENKAVSLYTKPEYEGFHWGLGVDLNKCTGCSACVVACQAENNVAVIGKEEIKNKRVMHWIRIDRYYSTVEPDESGPENIYDLESENPEVVHQPVMCQHCDNAPCENVCPVAATPHSKEGLNQMAYNRCIGTRYCMNNCPYRVRRFNWYRYIDNDKFDYNFNGEFSKMVLNPDVVVRERGVVEKCSFCVQRIQEGKLEAKKEDRMLRDGDVQPACVQGCPSKALVFGDMNNKDSKVAKVKENPRMYNLLEELHTLASVNYLTKVRNKDAGHDEHDGHQH